VYGAETRLQYAGNLLTLSKADVDQPLTRGVGGTTADKGYSFRLTDHELPKR
tara:strand:+ start:2334 stop:2489 length:156 start_codon:yes stop_codon:yes gene_type:complete